MTPRPRRPKGGDDGDGSTGHPSQRSGDVDASSSISGAQQKTQDIASRGRPGGGSGNGQPNQPERPGEPGSGEESSRPEWLRRQIEEGNEFNRRREPYYEEQGGANEVHVEPKSERGQYPRVDSYVPGEEIVSRKHTQLADVQEKTAFAYLRELANTYGPGTIVADTPTNRRDLGDDAIGQPMDGDMVLEVPVQRNAVPPAVLAEARRLGIIIRDENGHTY
ncbi:hypothetical protein [Goodfellowiella coeruleoviolacea]|uniref:tRNA nuclease CdiA C-terminal domain-containing protein n=1 Tax=Goodfellowiella coeruleoviolacea TaxID=334858 RepID=A0AAE3G9W7_9PSEU|nr:hypothetical protein [Goodfellowiella coeruleoviolacea]MCP2163569.1 hypothetical protein [Goodfellowiella coeruleoviolacea]